MGRFAAPEHVQTKDFAHPVLNIKFYDLEFVSDLEFRISDLFSCASVQKSNFN